MQDENRTIAKVDYSVTLGYMKPVEYLSKIEPIVIALFDALIHAERRAQGEHNILAPMLEYHKYQLVSLSQTNEYDNASIIYSDKKVADAREALFLIHTASEAAASAVLQIAKQCVSMAWPIGEHKFNKGRLVGSQPLSSVIWHARNQALHFEDGKSYPATKKCLNLLQSELGLDISNLKSKPRSLAKDIFKLLEWHSYVNFADDMKALLDNE